MLLELALETLLSYCGACWKKFDWGQIFMVHVLLHISPDMWKSVQNSSAFYNSWPSQEQQAMIMLRDAGSRFLGLWELGLNMHKS